MKNKREKATIIPAWATGLSALHFSRLLKVVFFQGDDFIFMYISIFFPSLCLLALTVSFLVPLAVIEAMVSSRRCGKQMTDQAAMLLSLVTCC